MLAEQRHAVAIHAPNDVFNRRCRDLSESLLLLDIEENDRGRCCKEKRGRATIEYLAGLHWAFDSLG